jgi:anti-sigma factor ChrR (cupin superfamily)
VLDNTILSGLPGAITKASAMEWIETWPDQAWMKVLWTGVETGTWAVLYKWKKGFVVPPHRHVGAAHIFILSGKLQVRDGILEAGDYGYEPNGAIHDVTTTLEDCEYLFICHGATIMMESAGSDKVIGYFGSEQIRAYAAAG